MVLNPKDGAYSEVRRERSKDKIKMIVKESLKKSQFYQEMICNLVKTCYDDIVNEIPYDG